MVVQINVLSANPIITTSLHHAVSLAQLNTGKILQLNHVMCVVTTVRHVIKMLRKTGNVQDVSQGDFYTKNNV